METQRLWQGRLDLLNGGVIRCPDGWSLNAEWSSRLTDFDLWFVWAGKGRMQLASGHTIELQRGSVLWMRPGGKYLADQDAGDHLGVTWQHFTHTGFRPHCWADIPEYVCLTALSLFDQIFRRVVRLNRLSADGTPIHQNLIQALFRSLLHMYLQPIDDPVPDRPHEVQIHQQIKQVSSDAGSLPTVSALARQAGYHPDHYRKLFRTVTGMSPKEWLLSLRIERAGDLLRETAMSIGEIADRLGYDDVYHFSRQFKQKTGLSPSRFRRNLPPLAAVSGITGSEQHSGHIQ